MIAIIDSGGTNIASVMFALERLDVSSFLTSDQTEIQSAERVILPGVGAARPAMNKLKEQGLVNCIKSLTQPVLGVCLGMQLLFSHSEESNIDMLNIIPGAIKHFTPQQGKTIPHMGWNSVELIKEHPLTKNIMSFRRRPESHKGISKDPGLRRDDNDVYFYFVHSYYAPVGEFTLGDCNYGDAFSAIVAKDNFMGCQFHPERSGKVGAQILKNFVEMKL
jgi:glutamine amidotransferase